MLYLVNAFSTNMLDGDCDLTFVEVPKEAAAAIAADGFVAAIGHKDTAEVVRADLELNAAPFDRISIKLAHGDRLLVAQYTGPRLEVGATELPEGATIKYWVVQGIRYWG